MVAYRHCSMRFVERFAYIGMKWVQERYFLKGHLSGPGDYMEDRSGEHRVISGVALFVYTSIFFGYTVYSELLLFIGVNPVTTGYFTGVIIVSFTVVLYFLLGFRREVTMNPLDALFFVYIA